MNRVQPHSGAAAAGAGRARERLIALAITLAALLPALFRPWIRMRADSWFHAAVVAQIERFGIPPEDPYFAGLKLQYMWIYHAMLALIRKVVPVSPFILMVIVNAAALFALLLSASSVARWLARRSEPAESAETTGRWALILVPFALGALFWLFFPLRLVRALTGTVAGAGALAAQFSLAPFGITTTRTFLSDFGSVPFFLNKFLVGTAYGLALVAAVVYLGAILRYAERPAWRPMAVAAIALFASLLFHPVVGFTLVAVSVLTAGVMLLLGPARGGLPFRVLAGWGAAVAAAFGAAAPYLVAITRGKPGEQLVPIRFDWVNVAGLLAGTLLVILLAWRPLRELWRGRSAAGRMFVAWIGMTFFFASFIRLPGPNTTDKFTYLLYLPLAIAAALGISRLSPRLRRLVVLLLIPANLLAWSAYWFDPDRSGRPAEVNEAYAWLREKTPPNAVILDHDEECDVVVRVPRQMYFGRESYAEQWGYDPVDMSRRRRSVEEMARGWPVSREIGEILQGVDRPLYRIVRRMDDPTPPAPPADSTSVRLETVWSRGAMRIDRIDIPPHGMIPR